MSLWNPAPTAFDRGGGSGLDVVAPIRLSPADGVTAMDFVFDYDPRVLTALSVHRTAFTHGFAIASDLSAPGRVGVSLSGGPALSGSGEVVWVLFHVDGASGAATDLSWISASLNGGAIPADRVNGRIQVIAAAAMVTTPVDSKGPLGGSVTVPIAGAPTDGALAIDLKLVFDPNVVSALGVETTPLTESMTMTYNVAKPGEVIVGLFQDQPIAGSGSLVLVTFQVVGAVGESTPVNLTRGDLNEQEIPTVLGDGLFAVCDGADHDGDGFSGCGGDCDDTRAGIHPGAVEVCNGLDDDCDGAIDDGIAPPSGTPWLRATKTGEASELSWTAVQGATGYDIVKGDLDALRSGGGDFASATRACLGNDLPGTTIQDPGAPATGAGFWLLSRAVSCGGAGTYDSGAPKQHASRDGGIAASSNSCP